VDVEVRGNSLKVYDIERALFDMVRIYHKADIKVMNHAMRLYAHSREKDIALLMDLMHKDLG
jgi:hypothetical protein